MLYNIFYCISFENWKLLSDYFAPQNVVWMWINILNCILSIVIFVWVTICNYVVPCGIKTILDTSLVLLI